MRPRRAAGLLLALAVAAIAAGGCGRGGASGSAPPNSGAAIFTQAGCSSCHTLAAAGSQGTTGPNLDQIKPSQAVVERQVRDGGGGMPSFRGQLSDQQIKAVAQYVASSAGHGAR